MLKILEKSLGTAALKEYWKRFGGWAIALKDKYWHDPFVKSEVNVVALQLVFATALFVIASIFFNYLYQDVLHTMIMGIRENIAQGKISSANIANSIEIIKSRQFTFFAFIIFALTIIFTFLISKITLRPAKEALASQKRFISDIAHELRTPLTVIKTNGEVFLMDSKIDLKTKDMVKSNIEELDRMSEIINNLLSLNHIIRPERVKFSNVDMGAIIDSAVGKLKSLAEKKQLEILIKKISPHVVWGNATALEQIVTNLLKNAINYTNESGRITIRIGPDYIGNILLHIEDTGIGITKNDLVHIFEPFYRAERSRNRKRGSSGLGLTIVSELVKMHSGRITIKSSENKGTTAIVTLPYSKNNAEEDIIDLAKLNEISVNFLSKSKEI